MNAPHQSLIDRILTFLRHHQPEFKPKPDPIHVLGTKKITPIDDISKAQRNSPRMLKKVRKITGGNHFTGR